MTLDALLAGFPPPPDGAWRDALTAELKGADPARLDWAVDAGVTLPPLVTAADAREAEASARVVAALLPSTPTRFLDDGDETDEGDGVDEEAWLDRGAAPVTALAATVRALRADPDASTVRTAVGPNVLLETARLRALRLLAARVRVDAGRAARVRVHASTARFWMTRAAPHTNLLRATTGATAAVLGGADTATVRPHDLLTGATPAARRLAAALPHLLADEAHLGTADAAAVPGGAFALDLLAHRLAAAAWDLAASDTDLDACAADDAAATHARIASGRLRLVGTTAYASADDRLAPLDASAYAGRRAAEPVEAARAAVEAAAAEHGTPETVLLRVGDDAAMATARATFVRGLLAVVGLPARETADVEAAGDARFVVLCGSDAEVQAHGPEVARRLASSCAPPTVFVAGPEDAALRARRVHGFVHARLPLLDAAQRLADAAFDAHGGEVGGCAL